MDYPTSSTLGSVTSIGRIMLSQSMFTKYKVQLTKESKPVNDRMNPGFAFIVLYGNKVSLLCSTSIIKDHALGRNDK